MMDVGNLIREARTAAHLTQAELAAAAGTAQPNIAAYESGRLEPRLETFARLIEACGADLDIVITPKVRRGALPLAQLAPEMAADMAAEGPREVYRDAVDFVMDARGSSHAGRSSLLEPRPELTGDRRVDALVAALAEFLSVEADLPIPRWTGDAGRSVEPWWFVAGEPTLEAFALAECPATFARHGVFVGKDAFAGV